jgi:hypothetical protein
VGGPRPLRLAVFGPTRPPIGTPTLLWLPEFVYPSSMEPNLTIRREGPLTWIAGAAGFSHQGQVVVGDTLWLTGNAYKDPALTYDTVYIGLGADERVLKEDQGVLPTMFVGPDGRLWAVVTNPYGDRDCEVVRPVGGRPHKGRRPFVGTPLWLDGNVLVLLNSDAFSDKPDRWLRYDLGDEKAKILKLPPPGRGKFLRNDQGIQCLAGMTHRLLSPTGEVLRERALPLERLGVQPVDLRFDGTSTAAAHDGQIWWWLTIGGDGSVTRKEIAKRAFYTLFPPERVTDTLVFRYVDETGNGWVCVRDGTLISSVHSTETGYVDGAGQTVIALPSARWVLSGLSIVGGEIAASVYEKEEKSHHPPGLWVARVALA